MNREEIAGLIPHSGGMCLLEELIEFTDESITCSSQSHLAADNPLRRTGRLSAFAGIEYGAQAMALHGALRARSSGRLIKPGYIAAVREVTLHIERLDQLDAPLLIRAQRIAEQPDSQMYRFSLEVGGSPEIEGRIAIFFRGEGAELLRP